MSTVHVAGEIIEALAGVADLVLRIPPGRRGPLTRCALSFAPELMVEDDFSIGPLRAALATCWEILFREPVPIRALREVLQPPMHISFVLQFGKFRIVEDKASATAALVGLLEFLKSKTQQHSATRQGRLFADGGATLVDNNRSRPAIDKVDDLGILVKCGQKFATVYADPPWPYDNRASRAAAVNHYPTVSVEEICAEPIQDLVEDAAHLHLWTTNAFLREAFEVIDAWGFQYKSCLVWVKDKLGMGNYWRVSHEYLLLGTRGDVGFRDSSIRSWIEADRTRHSQKPAVVRELVERVSPGPYLELYGRQELPDSMWTVYGNQIERRMF